MNEYTLDSLIAELQALKESGKPGGTPVCLPGSMYFVKKLSTINRDGCIAKADAKKYTCEVVFSRGVNVIILS